MIISILAFITVFTVVVLVHELGHFIAARKAGIKVYEFSIGFPFTSLLKKSSTALIAQIRKMITQIFQRVLIGVI